MSGTCEMTLRGHADFVNSVVLLRDGRLAFGSGDRTIKIWNILTGECEEALEGHNSSSLGDTVDKTMKIWTPLS